MHVHVHEATVQNRAAGSPRPHRVTHCPPLPLGPSAHPCVGGPGAAPGGLGGGRHDGIRTGAVRSVLLAGPPADCGRGRAGVPLLLLSRSAASVDDDAVRAGCMTSSVTGASKTDLRREAVLGLPPREGEGKPPGIPSISSSSSSSSVSIFLASPSASCCSDRTHLMPPCRHSCLMLAASSESLRSDR